MKIKKTQQQLQKFCRKPENEDSVSSVPCFHRFKSKSLQTKVDISVNLRSATPPCAVKEQPTECGEKSF